MRLYGFFCYSRKMMIVMIIIGNWDVISFHVQIQCSGILSVYLSVSLSKRGKRKRSEMESEMTMMSNDDGEGMTTFKKIHATTHYFALSVVFHERQDLFSVDFFFTVTC